MQITLFVPCHNEEASIRKSIASWLNQTRPPDQIVVVDDSSSDGTPDILAEFADRVQIVRTPTNMGNKSHAQEYGLQFVKGDITVTTDADTLLKNDFIEQIEKDFRDPNVAAVAGYVKSLRNNWLTLCRGFEYSICQNFHKLAQSYLDYISVIPGAAGAFRTDVFRKVLTFDHDTITEDMDFTYKLHKKGLKVKYNRDAIVYTQDPATLHCYINQMRRWFGGGWQNLLKHCDIALRPRQAIELSLMYIEGLVFAMLMFVIPILSLHLFIIAISFYFATAFVFSMYASIRERRADLLLAAVPYVFLAYVNSYIFLEQFIQEIIFRKKHLAWFQPQRSADL